MKIGLVTVLVVAALVAGYLARPLVDWGTGQHSGGANVECVAAGTVCVGQPIATAFGFRVDDYLGGVLDITCGYTSPGQGAFNHLNPIDLMAQDCAELKYVVSFSNGRRLTNLWVDAGRIVRIDDYPRHTIDP